MTAVLQIEPSEPSGRRSRRGHEGQFPPRRSNGRCRFGQGTLAGTGGKEEEAPKTDVSFPPGIGSEQPMTVTGGRKGRLAPATGAGFLIENPCATELLSRLR